MKNLVGKKISFPRRVYLDPKEVKLGKRVYKGCNPDQAGVITEVVKTKSISKSGKTTYVFSHFVVTYLSGRKSSPIYNEHQYIFSDLDIYLDMCHLANTQAQQLVEEVVKLEGKIAKSTNV